ncbi:MarR family winged helix-turn-helix transcriptional regulator [Aquibium oceanicum]|uniref:MarR family transcriptional regulator n=1 Tax=Aquibium oceanicum TaxID=1670800 RepID=A0A1L3STA0_9HYPH|nr:MarR family transcriptional regulator [Aquibium oceanicum]APH72532.1 MarR family transcriptional regulator [Aquibium oceanicum]
MSARKPLAVVGEAAPGGYRLEEQVGFALRKANQRHMVIFASRISDMTPPQFAALAKLYEIGETSQNQLGSQIAMDAATVKGVIDRLKARGLVALDSHKDDKRRIVVSLTDEGRQTIEKLLPLAEAITAETLAPLNSRDAAALMRLLSKLA